MSGNRNRRPTAGVKRGAMRRRGVILLVVMLLLSLFTLITLAMFLAASQARITAQNVAKIERANLRSSAYLNRTMTNLIAGSKDPSSPFSHNSLLEDIYGDYDLSGQLFDQQFLVNGNAYSNPFTTFYKPNPPFAVNTPNQTMLQFAVHDYGLDLTQNTVDDNVDAHGNRKLLSRVPNYYSGLLATFTNGRARNKTCRVIGYYYDATQNLGIFTVFWNGDNFFPPNATAAVPRPGDRVLVNGRPFSGTGEGFDPTNNAYSGLAATSATGGILTYPVGIGADGAPGMANVDDNSDGVIDDDGEIGTLGSDDMLGVDGAPGFAGVDDDLDGTTDNMSELGAYESDDVIHLALLPNGARALADNPATLARDASELYYSPYYRRLQGSQDNEDYDIPDYQNLFMAAVVYDPAVGGYRVALPSFHRPDLINFWAAQTQTPTGNAISNNPAFRHRTIMRPLPSRLGVDFTDDNNNGRFDLQEPYTDVNRNNSFDGLPLETFVDWNGNGAWDSGDRDFTGKPFNPINGPWDVDNDSDGLADSIWLDPGYPPRTLPDGRKVKVLVAVHCIDLDGRLNVNAHGNPGHYAFTGSVPPEMLVTPSTKFAPGPYAGGFGSPSGQFTIGSGYGPADVSLGPMLGLYNATLFSPSTTLYVNEYRQLLEGRLPLNGPIVSPAIPGRYGEPHFAFPRAGLTSTYVPFGAGPDGLAGTSDDLYYGDDDVLRGMAFLMGTAKPLQAGDLYREGFFPGLPLGYNGSPPDLRGDGSISIDLRGQPFYVDAAFPGQNTMLIPYGGVQEAIDSPYEARLDKRNRASKDFAAPPNSTNVILTDAHFSASEMVRLLGPNDPDLASVPSRLTQLAPSLTMDPTTGKPWESAARHQLTTDSTHVPTHHATPTPELRRMLQNLPLVSQDNRVNVTLTDLYAAKLIAGGYPQAQAHAHAASMLPFDLQSGLRFDLNRPFGNGKDDNGNGVVDEPREFLDALAGGFIPEPLWASPGPNGVFGDFDDTAGFPSDLNGDGAYNVLDALTRQQFATTLYVLAMLYKDNLYRLPDAEGLNPAQRDELTARRIAQWAVNAVDFRDRDNIMTPFEYDPNPFDANGYAVDGNFTTPEFPPGNRSDRNVVWGAEKPEALITETIAAHDRHVADLGVGGTVAGGDTTFDQQRVPQGSAFFEIHATLNSNNTAYEADLYTPAGELDLTRYDNSGAGNYPVFRLVVGESTRVPGGAGDRNNVVRRLRNQPETTSLELDDMREPLSGIAPEPMNVDRVVVFTTSPPPVGPDFPANRTYWSRRAANTQVLLAPGQYAVVGPHRRPQVGARNVTKIGNPQVAPAAHHLDLGPDANPYVLVTNNDGTPNVYPEVVYGNGSIKNTIGIPVAGDLLGASLIAWTAFIPNPPPVGLNISEPRLDAYYPPPSAVYTDPLDNDQTFDLYPAAVDLPMDGSSVDPGVPGCLVAVTGNSQILKDGTYLNYAEVFLQRLADPTQPYDPVLNPYRTVDWMPMDLTVFNSSASGLALDPDNNGPNPEPVRFGTRQRGMQEPLGARSFNIYKQLPWGDRMETGPGSGAPAAADPLNVHLPQANQAPFGYPLDHTLGFINESYQDRTDLADSTSWWLQYNGAAPPIPPVPRTSVLWSEAAKANLANFGPEYTPHAAQYVGDPRRPFPWFTWLNRPFSNPLELALVPATSSARMLHEYSLRTPSGGPFDNHYADGEPNMAPLGPAPQQALQSGPPFGHLLNFFRSAAANADPTQAPGPADAALLNPGTASSNHYRLFDLVRVPSRFSGTDDLLDPVLYRDVPGFAPPFNRLYRQREPGVVNINTIFDNPVSAPTLQGLFNSDAGWAANFGMNQLGGKLLRSRRGYPGTGAPVYDEFSNSLPTIFANPFRSAGQSYAVPIERLRVRPNLQPRAQIEATLLRPDPDDDTRPLFALDSTSFPVSPAPVDSQPTNTDRNPYFRYQAMQKLGNNVGTHSNVFAVWTTVGYFEVQPGPVDPLHPDGLYITGEMNANSGTPERRRSFFIYDRSVPVGFRRGEPLNVDRGILVQRVIE